MSSTETSHVPAKALLVEDIHPDAVDLLAAAGVEVVTMKTAPDEDALIELLADVTVIGIRSRTQLTRRVLESAPHLAAVGAFCIGTNQIDLQAATEKGIAVFNAPFSNTRSVVELAIAEIIALTRRLTVKDDLMHAGVWDKSAGGSHEVRGRSLGIIGYGNIGTQLSVLAEALGMSVFFYDTADRLALGNARRVGSMEELLELADVVSLHVDGRQGNSDLFGAEQFKRMRPGSLFLNLSRGFVVDHEALHANIVSGHLAGAAVDVFPTEPAGRGDPFVSPLIGLKNVILTPHVGGSTEEAQQDIGAFVANKVREYLADGTTTLSVNLPSLALPRPRDTRRVLLLHRNIPGVLASVNSLLAAHGVNIEGQLLGTYGEIGYVMTDTTTERATELAAEIRDLPATICLRTV